MRFPNSSRKMQNVQHLVSGMHSIFLVLIGFFFGKGETTAGVAAAVFAFLFARLSSELNYRIYVKVVKENGK